MELSRRTFLSRFAQVWAAMHLPMLQAAGQEQTTATDAMPQIHFDEIELQTAQPELLRDFYRDIIGLPVESDADNRLTIHAGTSRLVFTQADSGVKPFYHFAFNIPENRLQEAKFWLENRVPLLAINGTRQNVITFKAWNAHAIYFHDPAGNIVEFIARHDLPNASPKSFNVDQLLNISEIGLVTPDVPALSRKIQDELKIPVYKKATPTFTPLGNEHGLFILAKADRPWFPERAKSAETHPVNIRIEGTPSKLVDLTPLPFRVDIGLN